MQELWWRVKQTFWQWLAGIAVLTTLVVVNIPRACRFSDVQGERIFYVQSASSQGLRKEKLEIADLFQVRGECVEFDYTYATKEDLVEEMMRRYGAEVLFVERVGDVVSYYGYTPAWQTGVFLYGKKINLHIAVREATRIATMGTPIIFDGY